MTARGKLAIEQQERFNKLLVDAVVIIRRTRRVPASGPPKEFMTTLLKLMAGYLELCQEIDRELETYSARERSTIESLREAIDPYLTTLSAWVARLP